jgi:hypothetical protein
MEDKRCGATSATASPCKNDPVANLLDPFESTEFTYMLRENLAAVKHGIVYSVHHHLVVFVFV